MTEPTFLPVGDLDAATRAAMAALLDRHFLNVTPHTFEADLADKTHALLLRRGGDLIGFSTLARYDALGDSVVCSGDTIVDPSAWSSPDLPRHWIAAVRSLAPEGAPLWWLLLTSGFRTYRLLCTFWRTFVPHYAGDDERLLSRRDLHAAERFGARYDAAGGVVRVEHPTPLRPHLAHVPAERLDNPHVRHFLALNPGHAAGDELACFCALTDDNLTAAGRRMVDGGGR